MHVIDPDSATWKAVTAWAQERLGTSRATLEQTGTPLDKTEHHRGRVAALNELLKLPTPSTINPAHSGEHVE